MDGGTSREIPPQHPADRERRDQRRRAIDCLRMRKARGWRRDVVFYGKIKQPVPGAQLRERFLHFERYPVEFGVTGR